MEIIENIWRSCRAGPHPPDRVRHGGREAGLGHRRAQVQIPRRPGRSEGTTRGGGGRPPDADGFTTFTSCFEPKVRLQSCCPFYLFFGKHKG